MSRRDRRNRRSESPARPDSPPRDPGLPTLKGTILLTALALVASAVFFWQITRPTSFLSAIMQVEYSRLLPPEKGKPRADGGPTWETVYQQYQERLRKEPVTQRHFAVSDLLDAVVEVERGRRPAAEAVGKMQSRLAVDQDNAISRLAYGALVDAGAMGKSAMERFDEWRRIVEQPGAAKVSALYNKEYDQIFLHVLSGYIQRSDVRANLVQYMDHFLITDHYAALPMIHARLAKLADELNAAGKSTEAETCRRWVVRACLGLMEYEPDAGTRLLCADLAGRCLPADSLASRRLLGMITRFRVESEAARPDLVSFSRSPNASPREYRRSMDSFVVACSIELIGIGAALAALAFGVISLFSSASTFVTPAAHSSQVGLPHSPSRVVLSAVVVVIPICAVASYLMLNHLESDGLCSENLAIIAAGCMLLLGALCAVIQSSRKRPMVRIADQVRFVVMLLPTAIPICLVSAMPELLTGGAQRLNSQLLLLILLFVIAVIWVSAAFLLVRPGAREVARQAACSWAVASVLAVIALQVHWVFDVGYSNDKVVVHRRANELSARLGATSLQDYTIDAVEYLKTTP